MIIIPFICRIFCYSPIFFVTDFSAPLRAIVVKFCIHLQRIEVYCVKKNMLLNIAIFFPVFLFSIFHTNVMHIYIHIYIRNLCQRFLKMMKCFLPSLIFAISYSNVMHKEICVKDFSRTIAFRILKFGTNNR